MKADVASGLPDPSVEMRVELAEIRSRWTTNVGIFFLYKATIAAEDNARIFFLVYVLENHSLVSREEFFFFIGKEIKLELFTIIYPEFTGVWLPTAETTDAASIFQSYLEFLRCHTRSRSKKKPKSSADLFLTGFRLLSYPPMVIQRQKTVTGVRTTIS